MSEFPAPGRIAPPKYLLSGMVRCAVCGHLLQGVDGDRAVYQHVPRYDDYECTEIPKRIHGLDQLVVDATRDIALDPDLEHLVQRELPAFQGDRSTRAAASIGALEENLKNPNEELETLEGDLKSLSQARIGALRRIDDQSAVVAQLETERSNHNSVASGSSANSLLLPQQPAIRDILGSCDAAAKRILISNIAERISARPSTQEVEIALRYN